MGVGSLSPWKVPAGLVMALSGLWLTFLMPAAPDDCPALFATRLVVGLAILVFCEVVLRRRRVLS